MSCVTSIYLRQSGEMARLSVIIPTHNRAEWLPGAVDSVLDQGVNDLELIVVDDGSEDDSEAALGNQRKKLRYIRTKYGGVAAARNRGIAAANGEFIAFLDSDDRFVPGKLARQVEFMAARPRALISHTDEVWYRRGRFLNQKKVHARPDGYIFSQCLSRCCVGMSTVMVRPRFFELVGGFDPSYPCCEDYELWLRAAVILPFALLPLPLTIKNGGRTDQLSVIHRMGMDRFRVRALNELIGKVPLSDGQDAAARRELAVKAAIYGRGCLKHGRVEEGRRYLEIAEQARRFRVVRWPVSPDDRSRRPLPGHRRG